MPATADQSRTQAHSEFLAAGKTPRLVNVPAMLFAVVDGEGTPGGEEFQQAIAALYSFSYTLKSSLKRDGVVWKVQPLEGLWWEPRTGGARAHDQRKWKWRLMIAQPPQLHTDVFRDVKQQIAAKPTASPRCTDLCLARLEEGMSAQIMHIGPYDTEDEAVARLIDFIEAHDLTPHGCHHEIYLNDPTRTKPERLKTIIRQPVTTPSGQGSAGTCKEIAR